MTKSQSTTNLSTSEAHALLIDLYKFNQQNNGPVFKAKIAPRSQQYPELQLFKNQIEGEKKNFQNQCYALHQTKVRRYRVIFFLLGVTFLVLSACAFNLTMQWNHLFMAGPVQLVKNVICTTSVLLSLIALAITYSLCVAKESTNTLVMKAKKRLAQIYARKRLEHGVTGSWFFGHKYRKCAALKEAYNEMWDRINERRDETLHLLYKINKTKSIDFKTKEKLFNQALSEMNDQLSMIVHTFKNIKFDFS